MNFTFEWVLWKFTIPLLAMFPNETWRCFTVLWLKQNIFVKQDFRDIRQGLWIFKTLPLYARVSLLIYLLSEGLWAIAFVFKIQTFLYVDLFFIMGLSTNYFKQFQANFHPLPLTTLQTFVRFPPSVCFYQTFCGKLSISHTHEIQRH